MWRAWWRYGTRRRWTFRDYARHFGIVSVLAFTVAFPCIAVLIM